MSSEDDSTYDDTGVIEDTRDEVKEPEMYAVLLHNDHYTTMQFVVEVLRMVFRKSLIEATKIMLDVHRKGIGVVGAYTYDIASTKAAQVKKLAKERQFPLRCTVERA